MALMGQVLRFKQGPLTVSAGHAAAFVRTRPELKAARTAALLIISDCQARRGPTPALRLNLPPCRAPGGVAAARYISVAGGPAATPAIRTTTRYRERPAAYDRGLKLIRRIVTRPPCAITVRADTCPGRGYRPTRSGSILPGMGETVFHPASTCRIGDRRSMKN